MQQFFGLYQQLDSETLDYLENISNAKNHIFSPAHQPPARLLELLEPAPGRAWKPTWLGRKLVNWHRQLREASLRQLLPSQPRPEENGDQIVPACDDFRELLFSGVYCWCGRLRSQHPLEVVNVASRMLAHHQRNRCLGPLSSRVTGRSFAELADQVPSELRHLLQLLGAAGATVWELQRKLRGLSSLSAIQLGLDYLADLDLAYPDQEEQVWYPSWDGMGLRTWLQEQFVHTALHEVLPQVRPGENGYIKRARPCDSFRPLLSHGGGFCWCGHPFLAHSHDLEPDETWSR